MNDEEPPLKKNKLPIEPTLILSLPDDLIVRILAHVSRLYYPTLSFVCKRFRSLLTSPEFYQTRSRLGCTENILYVCLRVAPTDPIPRWFMLCPRPNGILTNDISKKKKKKKNKPSGYVLAEITIPDSPPVHGSGLVAVGSNIYNIGGYIYNFPSSRVSILDCWSHTWLEAPSRKVMRNNPSANFLDGKIYVTGGYEQDYNPAKGMEVFDLKNKTWKPVLTPRGSLTFFSSHDHNNNVVVDGELYINGSVAYNPKDGTWNSLGAAMHLVREWSSTCVIENVLYYYLNYQKEIRWYDSKVESWRTLNVMTKLPKIAPCANVRLADYGGKMALFWDKFVASGGARGPRGYQNRMIWCAMIALEKRNNNDIWGNIEWFGAVLPHPIHVEYVFEYVGAVNV